MCIKKFLCILLSLILCLSFLACEKKSSGGGKSYVKCDNCGNKCDKDDVTCEDCGEALPQRSSNDKNASKIWLKTKSVCGSSVTEYTYDTHGYLVSMKTLDEGKIIKTSQYTNDSKGNCLSVYTVQYILSGKTTTTTYTYEYDSAGRVIARNRSTGYRDVYEYNEKGLRIKEIIYDKNGEWCSTETYEYDNKGFLVSGTFECPGDSMFLKNKSYIYECDSNGNVMKTIPSSGNVTVFTYMTLEDYRKNVLQDSGSGNTNTGNDQYFGTASCFECAKSGLNACKGHACVACYGKGEQKCAGCQGTGQSYRLDGSKGTCYHCHGSGKRQCTVCDGKGLIYK